LKHDSLGGIPIASIFLFSNKKMMAVRQKQNKDEKAKEHSAMKARGNPPSKSNNS